MLVYTVDYIVPAPESYCAGRQIAPVLRLMSSDLILNELDDYDLNDLPAFPRLVYWEGVLDYRVVLSIGNPSRRHVEIVSRVGILREFDALDHGLNNFCELGRADRLAELIELISRGVGEEALLEVMAFVCSRYRQ